MQSVKALPEWRRRARKRNMTTPLDDHFANAEKWRDEAIALRDILRACDLVEIEKWNKPCYAHDGSNIAIIQRFNDFLSLMFFKGSLLKDPEGLLRSQGENTRSALRLEFTSTAEVRERAADIRTLVAEAIAVDKAGLKVEQAETPDYPEELIAAMETDPDLQEAFLALTPGRQRSYILHLSAAKQSATRTSRIEKCRPKILSGKGFNER